MQLSAAQHTVPCPQLTGRAPWTQPLNCRSAHRRSARSQARAPRQRCRLVTKASAEAATEARPSGLTPFAAVRSEQEFFGALQQGVDSGKLPKPLYAAFEDFYNNYKQTVLGSDAPDASPELVARIMGSIADRTFNQFLDPYTFPSYHKRLLEPYDYYKFGQNYVRTLINFNKSVVGHIDRFQQIQKQLEAGDNVVLLANHQTEADPGVWALLLEKQFPNLATEIIYVAGDHLSPSVGLSSTSFSLADDDRTISAEMLHSQHSLLCNTEQAILCNICHVLALPFTSCRRSVQ